MKIEDLIGKTFCTIAQRDLRYKIERVNEFGKVVISLNGKPTHELSYQIPSKVVELFKNGTWILIDEENKTPFYLDEYIYNNDVEKRVEAQDKCDERPIREVLDQICNPPSAEEEIFRTEWKFCDGPGKVNKSVLPFATNKEVDFGIGIQSTMQKIQELLLVKGKEYRRNNNPYHNFEVAARKKGITPERALDGFLLKHLVSYDDMLNDIEQGVLPKIEVVEEKFSDILVYFMIQKAQILNRINNGKS